LRWFFAPILQNKYPRCSRAHLLARQAVIRGGVGVEGVTAMNDVPLPRHM